MSQSFNYSQPWKNLTDNSTSSQTSTLISPLTKESILQLINLTKGHLPFHPPPPFADYTTQLVFSLLNTETYYSIPLCKNLVPSSPLWIAILISNTIKAINPDLHLNKHIHVIQPVSLIQYLHPKLIEHIVHFYTK